MRRSSRSIQEIARLTSHRREKAMAIHNFELGEVVQIINRTMGGKYFLEGTATIVRALHNEDTYLVQFHRSGVAEGKAYQRYVDPNAQNDIEAYIEKLNAKEN